MCKEEGDEIDTKWSISFRRLSAKPGVPLQLELGGFAMGFGEGKLALGGGRSWKGAVEGRMRLWWRT